MKTKVIFIIIFLLTMAFLPIIISKCSAAKTTVSSFSTVDEASKAQQSNTFVQSETKSYKNAELSQEELCGLTAANFDENYTEETLKALSVILYTNYTVSPDEYDLSDSEICLPESKAKNPVKENYSKIKSAVSSVYKKTLCKDGKAFYIPFCKCTNGRTFSNSEYPYLTPIASPWDCFSNADIESEYYGVSLDGINFLCSDGSTYEEALLWYLPDFTIQ